MRLTGEVKFGGKTAQFSSNLQRSESTVDGEPISASPLFMATDDPVRVTSQRSILEYFDSDPLRQLSVPDSNCAVFTRNTCANFDRLNEGLGTFLDLFSQDSRAQVHRAIQIIVTTDQNGSTLIIPSNIDRQTTNALVDTHFDLTRSPAHLTIDTNSSMLACAKEILQDYADIRISLSLTSRQEVRTASPI